MAEKEVVNGEVENSDNKKMGFLDMLLSDFGTDNSEQFIAEEIKDAPAPKGGKKSAPYYNMSHLTTIRKRTITLASYLKNKIDWSTANAVINKIPSYTYKEDKTYIVKKVVTLPYNPGKQKILKWFGQILCNPNGMYSQEVWFVFIRTMTEKGMHITSFDRDTKGRLISVTFEFTCIQKGGTWKHERDDSIEEVRIDNTPEENQVEVEDEGEEISDEELVESEPSEESGAVSE